MKAMASRAHRVGFAATAMALQWFAATSASAGSLQVAPVRIVLTPARAVAAMTIGNAEDAEMAVQAEVFAWSQVDGKDVYEPTRDVLVNPAIFRLGGQGQQIVRVGLRVPAGEREKSYRIFLQQLPRDQAVPADGNTGIRLQTLLRIGVPIFVPPATARTQLQWQVERDDAVATTAPRYRLKLHNGGTEHIQLTQIVLRDDKGIELARHSLSQYVLAGQAAAPQMALPAFVPASAFSVEVQSDAAQPLPAALLRVPADTEAR